MAMLNKLLITGAAGGIGRYVRERLGHVARTLRLTDIADPGELPSGAEFVRCDLGDREAVERVVAGCDGILHLGGISSEDRFDNILNANIVGLHNLYEAAHGNGMPRILFASSNHVIGFYRQDERIDAGATHRPDSWYGVSKSFGEAVALMYFHKFGQESALVRIGSCYPEPMDHRMLASWLAPEDFVGLVERVFAAPRLGCPVIYGVSDNDAIWWDNSAVAYLGWHPRRNAAEFAAKLRQTVPRPAADDPSALFQGGSFTSGPIVRS